MLQGQEALFSDSFRAALKRVPQERRDSFYYEQGKYYYSFHTRQSYHIAMECYLQSLKAALQYNRQEMVIKDYFGIGAVYDANNNIDNALKYYKLNYDKIVQLHSNEPVLILRAAYNMASVYIKGKRNANAYIYIKKMEEELTRTRDKIVNAHYHLLITNMLGKLDEKEDFYRYYHSLPQDIIYKDGELAYGRQYAEVKARFLIYEGRLQEAVEPLMEELAVTNDSVPLLNTIISTYAVAKEYKQVYEYQLLMDDVNRRTLDQSLYADINYRLLEADNLLKERDNKLLLMKEQQLNVRSAILYGITILLSGGFLLTFLGYKKFKKQNNITKEQNIQIRKQNSTNELLLKEIHHRVNNNLQIVNSLIELELSKPSGMHYFSMQEIRIKMRSIALAHQMMYENSHFENVDLQSYFTKMINITVEVFDVPANSVIAGIEMHEQKLNLNRLVPLALAVSEMLINTIKHVLRAKGSCTVSIECWEENEKLYFTYSDNGPGLPFEDLDQAKGTGVRLLRKLAQQMQASIGVNKTEAGVTQYTLVFDKD